jgi:hypothetical protein
MSHSINGRYHGLDTLRACAIGLMFLFHRGGGNMPSSLREIARFGWMGVDLFFVLSGYLIGTQLMGIGLRAAALHYVLRPLTPDTGEFGLAYIERIYYPTWTRLDGLIAGVVMAAVRLFRPVWWDAAMKPRSLVDGDGCGFCWCLLVAL